MAILWEWRALKQRLPHQWIMGERQSFAMIEVFLFFISLAFIVLLLLAILILTKGYGLLRIGWLNYSQLKKLEEERCRVTAVELNQCMRILIEHCQAIQRKWILDAEDLDIPRNTLELTKSIAAVYYPNEKNPVAEARIGQLLTGFLKLNEKLTQICQLSGVKQLTQFRIRHLVLLARAWKLKTNWEESPLGQFVAKYNVLTYFQWLINALRFLDLTLWAIKMIKDLIQEMTFKIILIRWYLMVGELSIRVFSEKSEESLIDEQDLLNEMANISGQELPSELPGGVRQLTEDTHKELVYSTHAVEWEEAKTIYMTLIERIARYYYPQVNHPLYEAKVFDLISGTARLAEEISEIRDQALLSKLLDLRVSHLLMMKDAADYLQDSEFLQWIKKYKLHQVLRFSNLLFQTIRKKHPGLLFKDFAFTLVKEGGKRWVYVYLHDRIAVEANHIFHKSMDD